FPDSPSSKKPMLGEMEVPDKLSEAIQGVFTKGKEGHFWNDPSNEAIRQVATLSHANKAKLRDWITERYQALRQGEVEGGNPLARETLVQLMRVLDGAFDKNSQKTKLGNYGDTYDALIKFTDPKEPI